MRSDRCLSCLSCLSLTLVCCGQTVGRIKMKLGMRVGLGPAGHIVLDGDPAPLPKGAQPPIFGPCLLGPNSCMHQDITCYGVGLSLYDIVLDSAHVYCGQTAGWMKTPLSTEVDIGPGHIVLDGDPAPPRKGHSSLPL